MKIQSEVLLACPLQTCFDWVVNPAHFAQWMQQFEARTPLNELQGQLGGRAQHQQRAYGKTLLFVEEITGLEAPHYFKVALQHKSLDVEAAYFFEARGTETYLRVEETLTLKSFFFRKMRGLIRTLMQQRLDGDLQTLRACLAKESI